MSGPSRRRGRGRKVVVLGGESAAGLALGRALSAAGYATVAAVSEPSALLARSRACSLVVPVPDPHRCPDLFVAAVAEAVQSSHAVAVLPATEATLLLVAQHREALAPAVCGAPQLDHVLAATRKTCLGSLAAAAGMQQPPTATLSAGDAAVQDAPLPAVVKPVSSEIVLADGTLLHQAPTFADTREELEAALRQHPGGTALVQERVGGSVVTVDGLAWQGDVVCSLQKQVLRMFPPDGGDLPYSVTVAPDRLTADVQRLVSQIRWSGPFNVQVVRTPERDLLIDLNPRAPDSLGLALAAGLDVGAQWCDLVLGAQPRPSGYRVGVRWRSEQEELWALSAAVRERRWADALAIARPHRRTAHAIWSWHDPMPAVGFARELASSVGRSGRAAGAA